MRRVCIGLAAASAGVAAVGLLLWFSSPGRPTDITAGYVPMAPSTGVLALVVSACTLLRHTTRDRRPAQRLADAAGILIVLAGAAALAARLAGIITPVERLLAPAAREAAQVPPGIMSPVTAALFVMCGAFLLSVRSAVSPARARQAAEVALWLAVLATGVVIVTGYAYGTPFLYGLGFIPVAPITGACFLLIGLSFWTLLPADRWPVVTLLRPTVRGRLLWAFVPLSAGVVIVAGAVQLRLLRHFANPAEGALVLAIAVAVGVGLFARQLASSIGGSADGLVQGHVTDAIEAQTFAAELERRVEERTEALRASNQELESFAYSVSHDLRGPLRAIDGFSHIVIEDYGDKIGEEGAAYLQRVRAASQRMSDIIDALLSLSGLTRRALVPRQVDLSRIVADEVARLCEQDPGRQAEVTIAPGCTARTDEQMVTALLTNLLTNAWKFTSRQDVAHIRFDAEETEEGIVYRVRDDGAGFDQTHVDSLFQPFQRLHDTREYPGTGIGLATVQRIVRRLGGRCWAEGVEGAGATFSFTLGEPKP